MTTPVTNVEALFSHFMALTGDAVNAAERFDNLPRRSLR
jgi:hypothetical protein